MEAGVTAAAAAAAPFAGVLGGVANCMRRSGDAYAAELLLWLEVPLSLRAVFSALMFWNQRTNFGKRSAMLWYKEIFYDVKDIFVFKIQIKKQTKQAKHTWFQICQQQTLHGLCPSRKGPHSALLQCVHPNLLCVCVCVCVCMCVYVCVCVCVCMCVFVCWASKRDSVANFSIHSYQVWSFHCHPHTSAMCERNETPFSSRPSRSPNRTLQTHINAHVNKTCG